MADYSIIKSLIEQVVKTNGEQEITGANLQNVLVSMINAVDSSNNEDFDRINGSILNLLNYVDAEDEDIRNEIQELANRLDTNRYGYNVTVFGLVAGVHTLATAVKNVPSAERFGGQKITFKTDAGWVTYQNTSLSIDNYEDVNNWVLDSGVNVEGDVTITNNPDYEDLTQNNQNELKFADKEYNAETYSGLGRVYLRKNIVSNKNVLTQAMLADANTIYIIQYDYDLNGASVTIPANCVLKFEGGSITNGTIIGQETNIKANDVKIFNDVVLSGKWRVELFNTDWFGVPTNNYIDGSVSCVASFQAMLNSIPAYSNVYVKRGNYYVDDSIIITKPVCLKGDGAGYINKMFFNYDRDTSVTFFVISSHDVTFDNIEIAGGASGEFYNKDYHTGIEIGDGINVYDDFRLLNSHVSFVNKGVCARTNNIFIQNTIISSCFYGVYFDNIVPLNYSRDVLITSSSLHSCNYGAYVKSMTSGIWSAITINGCDIGTPEKSALYVEKGRAIVFNANNIYNVKETLTQDDYIINLLEGQTINISNNSFIGIGRTCSVFNVGASIEGATINGNSIINYNGRCADLRGICTFVGNYCQGVNDGTRTINLFGKQIVVGNTFKYNATQGEACIQLRALNPIIGVNQYDGYSNPISGPQEAIVNSFLKGTSDNLRRKYSGLTASNKGYYVFDDTLTPNRPIWWDGTRWIVSEFVSSDVKNTGTLYYAPTDPDGIYEGFKYFMQETLKKPIYAHIDNDTIYWKEADGAKANVRRAGTFADKPSADDIYVGFRFLCFERTTQEGDSNCMEIIHVGNNVWVDALGRYVR